MAEIDEFDDGYDKGAREGYKKGYEAGLASGGGGETPAPAPAPEPVKPTITGVTTAASYVPEGVDESAVIVTYDPFVVHGTHLENARCVQITYTYDDTPYQIFKTVAGTTSSTSAIFASVDTAEVMSEGNVSATVEVFTDDGSTEPFTVMLAVVA